MTWRTRKHGDLRERVFFAWWPTKLSKGDTAWLEWVHVEDFCDLSYFAYSRGWKRHRAVLAGEPIHWENK